MVNLMDAYFVEKTEPEPDIYQKKLNIKSQVLKGIDYVEKRYKAKGNYIAYFQSYTNTNADTSTLEKLYYEALKYADFKNGFYFHKTRLS